MFGSLLRLTAHTEELAEPHVSIGKVGEVLEEAVAQLFGLVELASMNQVDGVIGHLVEPLALVINDRSPTAAGSVDGSGRGVTTLLFTRGGGGSFVLGQTAMLIFLAAAARTGLVASDRGHKAQVSLLKLFDGATFYHVLEHIDTELAETTRRAGCRACKGVVHKAYYPRKPRGGPVDLPASYGKRASYCCAVDGCRTRATPPSVRFLGRRVYLGGVVVLASALQHGVSAFRAKRLKELFGASRQTLERWRTWWLEAFPASRFWQGLRGRFMPAVDETTLPRSLVERFEHRTAEDHAVVGVLALLEPISTRPWLEASAT